MKLKHWIFCLFAFTTLVGCAKEEPLPPPMTPEPPHQHPAGEPEHSHLPPAPTN